MQHPSEAQLVAFNQGDLDEATLGVVSQHLGECSTCCGRLHALSPGDKVKAWFQRVVRPDATVGFYPAVTQDQAPTDAVGDSNDTDDNTRGVGSGPPIPTIPGYEMLSELGRGGMGVVYKARHLTLKRTVALKVVLAGGHAGPREQARFRIEAEAVARLQHPNIVQIHEVGEADGHPYCALEFVEGGNLARKLDGKPLPAREAAKLVEALARAMQLAHSRNVVHRDLKPANILLTADGTPKITDFGLARQMDSDSSKTQAGAVLGTPSYMAPEQASGHAHEAGPAADVYALGAILYDCLAGQPPFQGKTVVETIDQVRTQEPVPPSRWQPGVPLDLETICLKCLRKEPEKRYASAVELADELVRYQQGEPILARPVGRLERAVKWVRRNPVVAGAVVAVVLALAGGTTVSYLKYRDAEQQKQEVQKEADKAKKARDFLVSIFRISETDIQGGNVTARQILAVAEKRIPDEFAVQPELRGELLKAIGDVKRGIARRTPQAMLLEVRGTVYLQSATGVKKAAVPQTLVNLDDRLTLSADAQVQLVFLSDLHKERLRPGTEVTIDSKGCEPADAVLERDSSVLMTFVRLPKGTFYMGWNGTQKGVQTEIEEDFEIAVHDVTQGQWQAVMGNNPSHFSRKGNGRNLVLNISDEELQLFPVEWVSWDDAQVFIKKLNDQNRGRGYLYRLPTEAEWEYACRGGATSEEECSYHFYFDKPTNVLSSEQANINGNYSMGKALKRNYLQRSTRVGAYPPNKLGLCDMHGNVWQWCDDLLPGGSDRAIRGGCWHNAAQDCRAADRSGNARGGRYGFVGFRLVRVPVGKETTKSTPAEKKPLPQVEVRPPPAIAPFDAAQAKKHQEAWVKYLKVLVEAENKIGMKLLLIPPAGEALPTAYYLGKYEVTQGEWHKVMDANPSSFGPMEAKLKGVDTSKLPVETVSWYDSVEFCNKLSEREGLKPYYELKVLKRNGNSIEEAEVKILGGGGYHIPTSAEWEHSCRAGTKTPYYFGDKDEDLQEYAWFDKNSEGRTHAVGFKKPNAFGLYDMHGNVFEWNEEMVINAESRVPERVLRGGHWNLAASNCDLRSADRAPPAYCSNFIGLRLARTLVQEQDQRPRVPGTTP